LEDLKAHVASESSAACIRQKRGSDWGRGLSTQKKKGGIKSIYLMENFSPNERRKILRGKPRKSADELPEEGKDGRSRVFLLSFSRRLTRGGKNNTPWKRECRRRENLGERHGRGIVSTRCAKRLTGVSKRQSCHSGGLTEIFS